MEYRRLKDGTHAVGFRFEGRFIVYTTAFDAREAKALIAAVRAVMKLFNATSGAWVTMGPDNREIPRGATTKVKAARRKATLSKTRASRTNRASRGNR